MPTTNDIKEIIAQIQDPLNNLQFPGIFFKEKSEDQVIVVVEQPHATRTIKIFGQVANLTSPYLT